MNPINSKICEKLRQSISEIKSSNTVNTDYSNRLFSRKAHDSFTTSEIPVSELIVSSVDNPEIKFGMIVDSSGTKKFVTKDNIELGKTRLAQRQIYELNTKVLGSSDFKSNNSKLGLTKSDYLSIGEEVVQDSYDLIRKFYPKLYKAMLKMIIIPDESCDTLYVTYKKDLGKVELHYNPAFVAYGSMMELTCSLIESNSDVNNITDTDINNFVASLGTFFFLHELYHVLYNHLDTKDSPLPHYLENYTQDAYINTLLADVYTNNPILVGVWDKLGKKSMNLYSGISSQYSITGKLYESVVKHMLEIYSEDGYGSYFVGNGDIDFPSNLFDAASRASSEGEIRITTRDYMDVDLPFNVHWTPKDLESKFTVIVNHISSPLDMTYENYSKRTMEAIADILDVKGGGASGKTMSSPSGNNPDDNNSENSNKPSNSSSSSTADGSSDNTSDEKSNSSSSGSSRDNSNDEDNSAEASNDSSREDSEASNDSSREDSEASNDSSSSTDGSGISSDSALDDLVSGLSDNSSNNSSSSKSDNLSGMSELVNKSFNDAREEALKELEKASNESDSDTDSRSQIRKKRSPFSDDSKTISNSLASQIFSTKAKGDLGGDWRRVLKKVLEDSTGIKVNYNPDAPNARIQGQFGREMIETRLRDIIFSFDISASMEVTDFKKAVECVSTIMTSGMEFERCGFIYWTDTYKEVVPRRMPPRQVYTRAVTQCPAERDSTPISQAIEPFISGRMRSAKPDVIIIFTDGGIQTEDLDTRHKAWLRKNRKKIVWIIKKGGTIKYIQQIDKGSEKRIVRMK